MEFTSKQTESIRQALRDGDEEGAIETVFEFFPDSTRDEAVDAVEEIAREERPDTGNRRLTRQERLQGMADNGCDTWDEYHGKV